MKTFTNKNINQNIQTTQSIQGTQSNQSTQSNQNNQYENILTTTSITSISTTSSTNIKLIPEISKSSNSTSSFPLPFMLTDTKIINQISLKQLKFANYKDFSLIDSVGVSKKLQKSIIEISGRFNTLQEVIMDKSEYKLWFSVDPKIIDYIENIIYQDDEESVVKFEHSFDMLKVALALNDDKIANELIKYLKISNQKQEMSNSTTSTPILKQTIELSFEYLIFILEGKEKAMFRNTELQDKTYNFITSLIKEIITHSYKEDKFQTLFYVCEMFLTEKTKEIKINFIEVLTMLIINNSDYSNSQKIEFLVIIVKLFKFHEENGKNGKNILTEFIKTKLAYIILKEDFSLEDLNCYEETLIGLGINDEKEISSLKDN